MRVSLIHHLFICAAILTGFPASARLIENFNSRKGVPVHDIRMKLQHACWTFHHFDVNNNGWNPRLEGDGAMVSDINALEYGNAGIYTPMLAVGSEMEVSFDYVFNENFSASQTRWVKICLANAANEIVQVLETLEFIGVNATKSNTFSTTYRNIVPGDYRLILKFGGKGGTATIAFDGFNTSSAFKYPGGCNSAPLAMRDNITGMANRTASGYLLTNDIEKNEEKISAFLIKGSADGTVALDENGDFTFTPKANFKGNTTSFVYKICDDANLCSPDATVYIHFPAHRLSQFTGSYKYNGNVELAWTGNGEEKVEKYELERSMDGQAWQSSGIIHAKNVQEARDYTYMDKVGKNSVLKNDLYYRLKQIRNDGSVATSRLLVVRVYNTKAVSMIGITPNPSKSDISVNVQLHETAQVSMRMLDASGNTVLLQTAEAANGNNNLLLAGSSKVSPGSYTLEVIVNSKERMLVKLIKE